MGRPSKFTQDQMKEMVNLMLEHTDTVKEKNRMRISDEDMCSILCVAGYEVNINYVERLRRVYGISARNKDKYFDDDIAKIHEIIKQCVSSDGTNEASWKMNVSDAIMAEILKKAGYSVNAKYVERARRTLGIKPFQERLPQGHINQRLIKGDGDILTVLHEQAVLQLSIHRHSGNSDMYGTAGVDTYTAGIGAHTLGFEEAMERKEKRIQKLQNSEKKRRIDNELRMAKVWGRAPNIEEEDYSLISGNGGYSRGKGGSRKSLRDSQIYQSIY